MKGIELNHGFITMVDDDDYEKYSHLSWYARINHSTDTIYAERTHNGKCVKLHQMIMNPPEGKVVDHIDGNGLNNTKENLRVVSIRQNCQNKKRHRAGKLIGVSKHGKKYAFEVRIGSYRRWGGTYNNPQRAEDGYLSQTNRLIDHIPAKPSTQIALDSFL